MSDGHPNWVADRLIRILENCEYVCQSLAQRPPHPGSRLPDDLGDPAWVGLSKVAQSVGSETTRDDKHQGPGHGNLHLVN